jgi:hypothetical protein
MGACGQHGVRLRSIGHRQRDSLLPSSKQLQKEMSGGVPAFGYAPTSEKKTAFIYSKHTGSSCNLALRRLGVFSIKRVLGAFWLDFQKFCHFVLLA